MKDEFKRKRRGTHYNKRDQIHYCAKDADTLVIGALVNLDVLTTWLIKQNKNTLCLCSGWQDKFNLEDTICAGAISEALINTGTSPPLRIPRSLRNTFICLQKITTWAI